ncbi:hemicentin-1-like [Cololabis saira]|uniref:hemicentin-1-like n=1 Tax=Cololabis saira TaxID=129043 RepID=UPI002AD4F452|nr:hemicentin-1-like [Cololabis saira]
MKTRSVFIPSNGTFLINNLIRTDDGQYTLELQDSDGRETAERTLQLFIQAPVSSVLLVSECLSEGQMKVSCSSEGGDSPQYSWTLDGNTLTDSELLSGTTETNIIILKQNLSGRLVCSVRNHISRVSNETILTTCDGKTFCDGRRDGVQCYGALGGTVVLQLMDDASQIPRYLWIKDGTTILTGRRNTIIINTMETRSVFIPSNGTFLINNLIRTDSGQYTLELQDSDGRQTGKQSLLLFIQGGETYCDGRQDGVQCFGALGGTVVLQLMDNTSEIPRYQWIKEETIILNGKKNTIITNTMETRSVFIPSNGTFLINNLIRTDGGQYTLEVFDSEGRETGKQTLQLFIQAPVSSVLLVSECLSEGQVKVSCSSEGGDSPQYSWTLDGNTLTDSELLSGTTETNIIILKQNLSGHLVCSVRNHISRVSNETILTTCIE